jgi:VCBS repeat protein/FG-GAP repeat protein
MRGRILGATLGAWLAVTAPAAAAVFAPPDTHGIGTTTVRGIAAGDFNRDGDTDLAIPGGAGTSIILGGPAAAFGAASVVPPSLTFRDPVVADFNRDGDEDLVTTEPGSSLLYLPGGPGASFGPVTRFGVAGSVSAITAGDFDQDGDLDLAAAAGFGGVDVLTGDGAGGFAGPVHVGVGANPTEIAAADFNGDGDLDLAVAVPGSVLVLLGGADASFPAAGPQVPVGGTVSEIATGDLDADGNTDLVLANSGGTVNTIAMYGDGTGGFTRLGLTPVGGPQVDVAVADFDGDGRDDVVTTTGTELAFLPGGGHDLGAAMPHDAGGVTGYIAAVDADGDGREDVIVGHPDDVTLSVLRNIAVPRIETTPSGLTFATQAQDMISAARTIRVDSTGDRALRPRRVRVAGRDADDFIVTADTCSGEVIAPGGSCILRVRFAPAALGPREADLQIDSDAANLAVLDIPMSGVGGALPAGPRGPSGSTAVRPLLVAAFATDRVKARAGKRIRLRYVSTMAGVVTLELRRGTRVVRRIGETVSAGRNTLALRAPRKRGRYTLALTVTAGGQTVTDSARLTVARAPT